MIQYFEWITSNPMFDIGNPTETMYITFYRLKDVQAWLNGWDAMQIYKIKNGLMKKV